MQYESSDAAGVGRDAFLPGGLNFLRYRQASSYLLGERIEILTIQLLQRDCVGLISSWIY